MRIYLGVAFPLEMPADPGVQQILQSSGNLGSGWMTYIRRTDQHGARMIFFPWIWHRDFVIRRLLQMRKARSVDPFPALGF